MPLKIEKARQNLENRLKDREKKREERFRKATEDFGKIVELILRNYAPERIIQWGSLTDQSLFTEVSDIDIAVEGIKTPETFFSLLKNAEDMTNFKLDIVQLEKLDPVHREMIESRGKVVYER